MNRIEQMFYNKPGNIRSVYFTAGYPQLYDTREIILQLDKAGADILEIGIPFSDPMADGPVIQASSAKALSNGMTIDLLLQQLKDIRQHTQIPLLLMGYLNPVLQYGMERFCAAAREIGIDGLIIPDLPVREYAVHYKTVMEAAGMHMIFLITPATSLDRVREIDRLSKGFIYLVTSAGTTGGALEITAAQQQYFEAINKADLRNPLIAGFGISNKKDFDLICQYTQGAIIGSQFIRALSEEGKNLETKINGFMAALN
jgi:tryptophan synthase alpha chain